MSLKAVETNGQMDVPAGDLSLEFANTADWHAREKPVEFLNSYRDLADWARRVKILGGKERDALVEEAIRRPHEADRVLSRAISLREAIYRTFSSLALGKKARGEDLSELNLTLAESLSRLRVVQHGADFVWEWGGGPSLDRMMGPVAQAAAALLTSSETWRVGECAAHGCGWLFLDRSKNHSRRWCDMKGCGNRAKSRRHYGRQKAQAGLAESG